MQEPAEVLNAPESVDEAAMDGVVEPSEQGPSSASLLLRPSRFVEMLDEWPTLQELEDAEVLDCARAKAAIAEHIRNREPFPEELEQQAQQQARRVQREKEVVAAPQDSSSPKRRPPSLRLQFAATGGESTSPVQSPRLSPLVASVVRHAARLAPRPTNKRAKSTNDAPLFIPDELAGRLSADLTSQPRFPPTRSNSASPELERQLSVMSSERLNRSESRGSGQAKSARHPPRKLVRKSAPPSRPVIKVDVDNVPASSVAHDARRPMLSPNVKSDSPEGHSPTLSVSSNDSKRMSAWRRSLPMFSSPSAPSLPLTQPAPPTDENRRPQRTPSPIDAFPRSVRREEAFSPVDNTRQRRRGSTMSSSEAYMGDEEGPRDDRSSRRPARRLSVRSSRDASTTDEHGYIHYNSRSFDVVSRPNTRRPAFTRSQSDALVEAERQKAMRLVGSGQGGASGSSLSLSKIEETAEDALIHSRSAPRRPSADAGSRADTGHNTRSSSSNATIGPEALQGPQGPNQSSSPGQVLSARSSRSLRRHTRVSSGPSAADALAEPAASSASDVEESANDMSTPSLTTRSLPRVSSSPPLMTPEGPAQTRAPSRKAPSFAPSSSDIESSESAAWELASEGMYTPASSDAEKSYFGPASYSAYSKIALANPTDGIVRVAGADVVNMLGR